MKTIQVADPLPLAKALPLWPVRTTAVPVGLQYGDPTDPHSKEAAFAAAPSTVQFWSQFQRLLAPGIGPVTGVPNSHLPSPVVDGESRTATMALANSRHVLLLQ